MGDSLKFKIIFLGDPGVGKSAILNRYTQDKFDSNYHSTIGLDFHTKIVNIEGKSVKFLLYDTAGQEKFRSLIPMYIRDANIIIIVYDITKKDTLEHTKFWMNEIKDLKREDSIIALVGNKLDLDEQRETSDNDGKSLANENNFIFLEVCAKTGDNINSLFENYIYIQLTEKYNLNALSANLKHQNIHELNTNFNDETKEGNEIEKNIKNLNLNQGEKKPNKKKCCK